MVTYQEHTVTSSWGIGIGRAEVGTGQDTRELSRVLEGVTTLVTGTSGKCSCACGHTPRQPKAAALASQHRGRAVAGESGGLSKEVMVKPGSEG